jgi:hypothetical protein
VTVRACAAVTDDNSSAAAANDRQHSLMGDMARRPRRVGIAAMASPVGVISHLVMTRIIPDSELDPKSVAVSDADHKS